MNFVSKARSPLEESQIHYYTRSNRVAVPIYTSFFVSKHVNQLSCCVMNTQDNWLIKRIILTHGLGGLILELVAMQNTEVENMWQSETAFLVARNVETRILLTTSRTGP